MKFSILTMIRKYSALALIPALLVGCNSASSDSTTSSSSDSMQFPSSLAVASPTSLEDSSSASESVSALLSASSSAGDVRFASSGGSAYVPSYTLALAEITSLLSGTTPSSCTFDPEDFLVQDTDADCFGPQVAFENHPDASGSEPTDGTLPSGDVGLWTETDATTGNACAADQLDARMRGMEAKSNASLKSLASLICTATLNGIAAPDASTPTVDLTTEMNAIGVADTTFTLAEATYDSSTGAYGYNLEFNYAPGSDSHDIVVNMEHTPTTSSDVYTGQISYLVNDTFTGGNCPSNDVTLNGSLQYDSASSTEMALEVRTAQFCEHDSDGRNSSNLVDPSEKYDSSSNPTGWGNNFGILTAEFDPTALDGSFAYSWQAGPNDSNARIFNIQVENTATTAIAYYGYGDDIASTDGSIEGFICNWAGPGADHTLIESAQYQELSFDTTTGIINADVSNIEYAPVVDCETDGTGSVIFDLDIDGDLTDEDPAIAIVDDLAVGSDIDGDGNSTIEEVIDDSGFTLPSM